MRNLNLALQQVVNAFCLQFQWESSNQPDVAGCCCWPPYLPFMPQLQQNMMEFGE
jgi:hypothetical protein